MYEMHTSDLLAVHVEIEQLLLLINAVAKHVALNVSESNDVLVFVDAYRCNLVLVVVEVLLIIQHVSNVPEHLDGTVP